jgi:hypothetical protein
MSLDFHHGLLGDLSFVVPERWKYEQDSRSDVATITASDGRDYCALLIVPPLAKSNNLDRDFVTAWKRFITPVLHDPLPDSSMYEHRSRSGYSGRLNGSTSPGRGQQRWVGLFLLETETKAIPVVVVASTNAIYLHLYDTVVAFLDSIRIGSGKAQPPKTRISIADLVGEWETGSSGSHGYVNRSTGAYAGSLTITTGWGYAIAADGSYTSVSVGMMNGMYSRSQARGRVEFTNGEIVFREHGADRSTRYRFIKYETAPDGSTVLTLLPAVYEATPANISFYGEKWNRPAGRS